ncbi:nitrogen fixation protein NifX [Neiella sp. HB171785]|uniref:Nitrogen fixation protein NifX n=1 Tax=Neiella litorisoli TaxID=2771431 RepID=A0A8J6UI83_9GAMM|nr:NifB/NifX family molybdenum-iron cluster-binding protein [Neiella litorisoli]MBD1388248.1 nitrogen fixation protein NifX [Neiella litorisoli]
MNNVNPQRKLQLVSDPSQHFELFVAFATDDQEHINQHFGTCKSLSIYGVDRHQAGVAEIIQFNQMVSGHDQGKLQARYDALHRCAAVYCNAIGPSAIAHLVSQGVQPVKVAPEQLIHQAIIELQTQLVDGPKGWLGKALRRSSNQNNQSKALTDLLDESW